jgi:ribosomal protein S18 acetylase RimI-like enzyme
LANSPFQISLARPNDCVELAELSRVAIEYDLRWRWKPSRILKVIRDVECTVIVARDGGGELLGFAAMEFKDTRAHLNLLATAARFRRQGIASALLNWLETSARVAGIEAVSLEVRYGNQAAVKFYESHGYMIERIQAGYYDGREDAYRMRHDLMDQTVAMKRP